MQRLAICRICLNPNASHLVPDSPLQEVYEKLTLMPFQSVLKPSWTCYICYAMLQKTHKLRLQCLKAEERLKQMLYQVKHDTVTIHSTDITRYIFTPVQHVNIEATHLYMKEDTPLTYEEGVRDVKTDAGSDKDVTEPPYGIHSPPDRTNLDNELASSYTKDDDIPLNHVKKKMVTAADKQNTTTFLKEARIGLKQGNPVVNPIKLVKEKDKNEINQPINNINSIKDDVTDAGKYVTKGKLTKCKFEPQTEMISKGIIIDGMKYNTNSTNKLTISSKNTINGASDNESSEQGDSFGFQDHRENTIDNFTIDKRKNNKQNPKLTSSNKYLSAHKIENDVQYVNSEIHRETKSDTDDIGDRELSENYNKYCRSSREDCYINRRTVSDTLFICDVCGKDFKCKSKLQLHIRIHTGERPYICDVCSKSFSAIGNLNRHRLLHTGERPHRCHICDMRFTQIGSLKRHIVVHFDARPFPCDICDKRYVHKVNLIEHMRSHTGERPYACDMCDKRFKQMCSLRLHVLTHTGVKSYVCKVCNKGFVQKGTLQLHSRTHTGEKPYTCDMCDKSFSQKCVLRVHTRVHTGERPFTCDICDKKFKQHSNLLTHLRTHATKKSKLKQNITFINI